MKYDYCSQGEMMKIAVNTRFLLKDKLEGIGWYTFEVMQRLVRRHPEDEFLFFFDRPFDSSFVFGPNVRSVVLYPPARHPVLWWWWFELSLGYGLRRFRPDVFFSPDGYCSLNAPTPTVMVTHDIAHVHFPEQVPGIFRSYYDFFVPRYLRRADRVLTVSDFVKNDITAHYGIPPEKITVGYNGSREGFFPVPAQEQEAVRTRYSEGKPYFFYLGAVHPRKNVHRLIRAFDRFREQTGAPVLLLIGGRFAWQTGEVKEAYDAARYKEDVRFLGYIDEAELSVVMGSALALVYVSVFEGFGLPLLEAMHADVPVLTSNVSSLPEVAGDAGLTVNPFDVEEIAGAMVQLYRQPDLRRELVEKGRVQREKFSWEHTTAAVYDSLARAAQMYSGR